MLNCFVHCDNLFKQMVFQKVVTSSDVIKDIQKTKEEPRCTNFDRKRKTFLIQDSGKNAKKTERARYSRGE